MSFFFMPAVIGACTGIVMRLLRDEGSFGLAGFAVAITALAGLFGIGMQHWLNINKQLQKLADVTYNETIDYARLTSSISDEKNLREVLAHNQTAVVGRLAAKDFNGSRNEFWFRRNYIHFNWVAARQITIYGQGGAEKTIWEATQVFQNGPFADAVIQSLLKQPITDADVSYFQQMELPFLRKLAAGDIVREDFEAPLITLVREKVNNVSLASRGFEPLTGGFLLIGCILSYKLVRDLTEQELV